MVGIVHRGIVENDEILVCSPAPYIEAAGALTPLLHTRHQLYHSHHIALAQQHRGLEHRALGYRHRPHARAPAPLMVLLPLHQHLGYRSIGPKVDRDHAIGNLRNHESTRRIAHIAKLKSINLGRHPEGEESIAIGGSANSQPSCDNVCPKEGLA